MWIFIFCKNELHNYHDGVIGHMHGKGDVNETLIIVRVINTYYNFKKLRIRKKLCWISLLYLYTNNINNIE